MDLLIIDEWLLTPIPEKNVYAIFEIIEARFKKTSTIFSSQKAPEGRYEQLGDTLIADVILDRIVVSVNSTTLNEQTSRQVKSNNDQLDVFLMGAPLV